MALDDLRNLFRRYITQTVTFNHVTRLCTLFKYLSVYLFSFFSLVFLCGCCRPTYPANRVIQSVRELCKDEYGLDVEARILGRTLGVAIPIEGLVDKELRLDRQAADKIEDVALSMRRVILSTERPIDFYLVCAQDTKMRGAEYIMTSNTLDVKRVAALDISREEYLRRIQKDFRLNPQIWGEAWVKNLFDELNSGVTPESVLAKYARFAVSADIIRQIFYPAILIARPQSLRYQILNIQSKELAAHEALFLVRVKETYTPRDEAAKAAALFPPGFVNEYLIWLMTDQTKPVIEIAPVFFEQENSILKRNLQQIFDTTKDLAVLDSGGLPVKEIDLKEFVAAQIARRLKEKFRLGKASAVFEDGVFKLALHIDGNEQAAFRQTLILVGLVTHGYWLEDFTSVEVTAQKSGKKLTLSKEELEHFRRRGGPFPKLIGEVPLSQPRM